MEEQLTPYPDNSAVPIIITPIIGKHMDNVNPGGEERFNPFPSKEFPIDE